MLGPILCFIFGVCTGAMLHALFGEEKITADKTPRPPKKLRCRAVLRSGEQCEYDAGHDGYHRTSWPRYPKRYDSPLDAHCWEDPDCGVHPVVIE